MEPATIIAGAAGVNAAMNVVGGALGGGGVEGLSRGDQRYLAHHQLAMAERNEQFQRDLATRGIQMRVADAEAAGLHPLAALGVNPASNSFSAQIGVNPAQHGEGLGSRLRDMGQNIGRAAAAVATPYERQSQALGIENQHLQNELIKEQLLQAQWDRINRTGPAMPEPSYKEVRNKDGSTTTVPSDSWMNSQMHGLFGFPARLGWMMDNKMVPQPGNEAELNYQYRRR